jgi:hypothetical protein
MRIQLLVGIFLLFTASVHAQKADSLLAKSDHVLSFPNRFFSRMQKKSANLNAALDRQTQKYLNKLRRKEDRFRRRLTQKDSASAARLSASAGGYGSLRKKITNKDSAAGSALSGEYLPYVDSLKGSLAFLQQNQSRLNLSTPEQNHLTGSLSQFNELQGKLRVTDQVKAYIAERKEIMQQELQHYANDVGLKKYLDDYNREAFYYSAQVRAYKEMLNNPDAMLKKALVVLNKIPAFSSFMKQFGQLAGIFGISPDYGTAAGLAGLQTRVQVQQLIQGQVGAGGSSGMAALQSNLESAHQQLDQFKDKLSSLGSGSGDMDMPDFQPNPQKTKSFLKRIELGTNMQTTRANYFFPSTTDIGLSIGYKLPGNNIIGIGGSYKIGWGQNISHIRLSSEGASIRSFLDIKLKKSFYASGGYELNYQQAFTSFSQISSVNDWTRSGLIGISKIVSLGGKVVRKTKVQILWDFLWYSQEPRTASPFKFRVGYNF